MPTDQSWGGDSFAWYTDRVPGTYARGVHNGQGPTLDLHASTFDVDEQAIGLGLRAMVAVTRKWFAQRSVSRKWLNTRSNIVFSRACGRTCWICGQTRGGWRPRSRAVQRGDERRT